MRKLLTYTFFSFLNAHLTELSAVTTRLELATLGVTGRYSNQLNYRSVKTRHMVLLRHPELDSGATILVGVAGVEPATYAL